LWATPVVQGLGHSAAYANFRGSGEPGYTCMIHVTAYPANIVLQVVSTLTCIGGRANTKSCSDTKVRKICFTQVTGSESQRCGRFEPHRNTRHGTQKCH
jgi:hypothetical protein